MRTRNVVVWGGQWGGGCLRANCTSDDTLTCCLLVDWLLGMGLQIVGQTMPPVVRLSFWERKISIVNTFALPTQRIHECSGKNA